MNPNVISLRQNMLVEQRQAFMLYWALHKVWEQSYITVLICVARLTECMLWAQFKPWGAKKDSVPYMAKIVLTNVLV